MCHTHRYVFYTHEVLFSSYYSFYHLSADTLSLTDMNKLKDALSYSLQSPDAIFRADLQYFIYTPIFGGAWVAQLVKLLTLGFSSGHDLTICKMEPHIRLCMDSPEPAWDIFFLFLSFSLSLSLRTNISKKKSNTHICQPIGSAYFHYSEITLV